MRKTKFTYLEWHYTNPTENLFDLDKDALSVYRLLIKAAS